MALSEIVGPIPGILKLIGVDPTRRETSFGASTTAPNPARWTSSSVVLALVAPLSSGPLRPGFIDTKGDVHYGYFDVAEKSKRYMGEVTYSEEDDWHQSTLSVAPATDLALRLKATSKMLPSHTGESLRKIIRDTLLKTVDIEHTNHTLVDSATVRSVSGGERKQVSVCGEEKPLQKWR